MPPLAKTYMILGKSRAGERRTPRRGFKDEAFNSLQLNYTVVPTVNVNKDLGFQLGISLN
jgi:hypothetical protein